MTNQEPTGPKESKRRAIHWLCYWVSGVVDIAQGVIVFLTLGTVKLNWSIRWSIVSHKLMIGQEEGRS